MKTIDMLHGYLVTLRTGSDFSKDEILMEELYDYERDPLETISFASDPSYKKIKDDMIRDLRSVIWSK